MMSGKTLHAGVNITFWLAKSNQRLECCGWALNFFAEQLAASHLEEAADVVAHELPQDGEQQLVLAVDDVDAADVDQRQRQHPPRDVHHLRRCQVSAEAAELKHCTVRQMP